MSSVIPPKPATPRGIEPRLRRAAEGGWQWRFRVRWTDPMSHKRLVAEFDTIEQAEAFQARLRFARARGDIAALTRGDRTLETFVEQEWWPKYAGRVLERSTLRSYASIWNNHLAPHVGRLPLRLLSTPRVSDLRDQLLDDGVGVPTVRQALAILQSICSFAVEAGELDANPVRDVKKPPPTRHLAIVAPSPAQVEALRAELDPASATLVSVMGYEGLRPQEALALEERHLGRGTLLIEQRLIEGQIVPGVKTSRRKARGHRSPTLYRQVREDLEHHLATLARRRGRRMLFPGPEGGPWTLRDYDDWRESIFWPAAQRAGVTFSRGPYDLRHGCASLLLHAGWPLTEISEHMGHSVQTLSTYYAHLIADLRGADPIAVEEQIAAARANRRAA